MDNNGKQNDKILKYPTIITFYTSNWEYKKYALELKNQCEKFNLDHYIKEYPDTGNWLHNTRIKPRFIKEAFHELQRPLLWIDADGILNNKPNLLELPIDKDFMGRHQRSGPKRNWHVGTLFFNHTENTSNLIDLWNEYATGGSDEHAFEKAWINCDPKPTHEELPPNYFHIIRNNNKIPDNAVIAHRLSRCPLKIKARKKRKRKRK